MCYARDKVFLGDSNFFFCLNSSLHCEYNIYIGICAHPDEVRKVNFGISLYNALASIGFEKGSTSQ